MNDAIWRVEGLNMVFHAGKARIHAVNDVSFSVRKGETIGVVGESGCGKTTLGRCVVRAYEPTSGHVYYTAEDGKEHDLTTLDKRTLRSLRKEIQMIFQDPFASLDPRMTVFDIISEPLTANFPKMPRAEKERMVQAVAEKVGLNPSYLKRYPHAFSGGQRQRIGIARALIMKPRLIICDEAVSALDVSVQAQVVNLLRDLQRDMGLTYLFISHDLSVVEHISDRVGVMYLGRLVEYAPTDELFARPLHPYTEALLSAVPVADPKVSFERIALKGEIPNPANAPSGCSFHTRCRYAAPECSAQAPSLATPEEGRLCACMRYKELSLRGMKENLSRQENHNQ